MLARNSPQIHGAPPMNTEGFGYTDLGNTERDSEAALFQNGRLSLGNRPFQKKQRSESRNINR